MRAPEPMEQTEQMERLAATRISASPSALDAVMWPAGAIVLRTAPDEVIVTAVVGPSVVNDPHAIVEPETSLCAVWMTMPAALDYLARECNWELPAARPAFAQGSIAGLPVKLWFEHDRVLFVVPGPFAFDFAKRLR